MKTEKVHNKIRYTFSNENLKVGDKVYPIAHGRCLGSKIADDWVLHNFDFRDFMSGFPDEAHTILDLNHSKDYKPYQVHTDHGFGPIEIYYKIIKREIQVRENDRMFSTYKWVELEGEPVM